MDCILALFKFHPRRRRISYFLLQLPAIVLQVVLPLLASAALERSNGEIGFAVFTLAALIIQWIVVAITVQRLHDANASGWWAVLVLNPIGNFLFWFVFSVVPGSKNNNRFGPNPRYIDVEAYQNDKALRDRLSLSPSG